MNFPAKPSVWTEVSFIDHCEEGCGLGSAEFDCPACGRTNHNYAELWFDRDNLYDSRQMTVECEYCKVIVKIGYNREDGVIAYV